MFVIKRQKRARGASIISEASRGAASRSVAWRHPFATSLFSRNDFSPTDLMDFGHDHLAY